MKRFLASFVVILFMCSMLFSGQVSADNTDSKRINLQYLLDCDGEEALTALLDAGLVLPEVYLNNREAAIESTQTVLRTLSHYNGYFPYNYRELICLGERILALVDIGEQLPPTRLGTLEDSTNLDSWHSYYANYNCYAYALGIMNDWYVPGDFSPANSVYHNIYLGNVTNARNAIISDLSTLGYNSSYSTSKPTSIGPGEKVICVRCGDGDFHVMYAYTTTKWRHKPAGSVPLQWNYSSPGYKTWTNEMYIAGNQATDPDIYYTSTIYYITYWLAPSV